MPLVTEVRAEGVKESTQQLIEFFRAFREGRQDVQTVNAAMRETAAPIYGMRRSLMLLRTEWRMMHAAWIESARLMRDVGRIGRNITQMWTAYTVGQIRVEQAQKDVAEATESVAEAQAAYNRYLEVFGEKSVFTQRAYEELKKAQEKQKEALQKLHKAQQDQIMGYIGMALQIGDIIAALPLMAQHISMVRRTLATANITAKGFATTLGTIGAVLGGIFLGVEAAKALADAFGEMGAVASMIIGSLIAVAAVLAAIALHVSIISFGGAALAGIAAFGAAMAVYGGITYATMPKGVETPTRTEITAKPPPETPIAGGRQYGGFIPETGLYLLHAGEYVVPESKTIETTTRKTVNIHVTNYFGAITSEIDIETAGEQIADKIMKKLGERW